MFCKWCGLESESTDVCSWCRHPLSSGVAEESNEAVENAGSSEAEATSSTSQMPVSEAPDSDPTPTLIGQPLPPQALRSLGLKSPGPAPGRPTPPPRPTGDTKSTIVPLGLKKPGSSMPPPVAPLNRPQPVQAKVQPPTPVPPSKPAAAPPKPQFTPPPAMDIQLKTKQPTEPIALNKPVSQPERQQLKPLSEAGEDDIIAAVPLDTDRIVDIGAPVPSRPVAPPPERKSAVPKAGGRTWYCKWCGMQSESPDMCSWCNKDIRNMPTVPGSGPQVILTKDKPNGKPVGKPSPTPAPPALKAPAPKAEPPKAAAPKKEADKPQRSKYYTNQMVDPVSGNLIDPKTGKADDTQLEAVESTDPGPWANVGYYVAGLIVVTILAAVIGGSMKSAGAYLAILGISNFMAGIALPLLKIAPFGEDDSSDLAIAAPLMLLLGPFVGGAFYATKGVITQDVNPAFVGIFGSGIILRVALDLATGHPLANLVPLNSKDPIILVAQCLTVAGVIGWYAAGMFHKLDE